MVSDINETDLHAAMNSVSVDEALSVLSEGIRSTMEQNIPSKQVPMGKEWPMWFSPEAKEGIWKPNQSWTRFRMSKRPDHFTVYKRLGNEASNKLKMSTVCVKGFVTPIFHNNFSCYALFHKIFKHEIEFS